MISDAAYERARTAALLPQTRRRDVHGLPLGARPDGQTVTVAADGTTSPPPDDHDEGHCGDPPRHGPQHEHRVRATNLGRIPVPGAHDTAATVRVGVLGPTRIDPPLPPGELFRGKAQELLVYLIVHDGTATQEAILEDLLPDAPHRPAPRRLHTYTYNLRQVLTHTGGPGTYLDHPKQRYVLTTQALDVDLWTMRAALRDADTAPDPATRTAALRHAVACYTGPLAQHSDYEWAEPYRQAIRREALDAHLALARELAHEQPYEALRVLADAIGHDPYAEAVYRETMLLHAQLGDIDAIRATRHELTRKLNDIDAEPGDDTLTLADRLVSDLAQPAPSHTTGL